MRLTFRLQTIEELLLTYASGGTPRLFFFFCTERLRSSTGYHGRHGVVPKGQLGAPWGQCHAI